MTQVLAVLARSPAPGQGKTRLRAALADRDPALVDRLVHAMVEDTLAWASRGRTLLVAGDGEPGRLRALAPAARLVKQPCAGFGERIERALCLGLAARRDASAVVQIGTDSPTLPDHLLESAYSALREREDAVLIPADDGGWVALGVVRCLDGSLAEAPVRWSTEHAAGETLAALRAAGRRVTVLQPWFDVDGLDGLRRICGDPVAVRRAPRTVAAVAALDAARCG